jgi:hypothetical protein
LASKRRRTLASIAEQAIVDAALAGEASRDRIYPRSSGQKMWSFSGRVARRRRGGVLIALAKGLNDLRLFNAKSAPSFIARRLRREPLQLLKLV